MIDFLLKYFWVIIILNNLIKYIIIKSKANFIINHNYDLKAGYDAFCTRFLLYTNIPWIIYAIGFFTKNIDNVLDLFIIQEYNSFILIFYSTSIIIIALTIHWILFKDGAKFYKFHPRLMPINELIYGTKKITIKHIQRFWIFKGSILLVSIILILIVGKI